MVSNSVGTQLVDRERDNERNVNEEAKHGGRKRCLENHASQKQRLLGDVDAADRATERPQHDLRHSIASPEQPFNGLFSRTTWVSRYQKGKTNLDFTGARDRE